MSSSAPDVSADNGVMASATEYDSDATCNVDHTTDTGLGGGDDGGWATVIGILEETAGNEDSAMGWHSRNPSPQSKLVTRTPGNTYGRPHGPRLKNNEHWAITESA